MSCVKIWADKPPCIKVWAEKPPCIVIGLDGVFSEPPLSINTDIITNIAPAPTESDITFLLAREYGIYLTSDMDIITNSNDEVIISFNTDRSVAVFVRQYPAEDGVRYTVFSGYEFPLEPLPPLSDGLPLDTWVGEIENFFSVSLGRRVIP